MKKNGNALILLVIPRLSFCLFGQGPPGKSESPIDPGTASGEGRTIKVSYNIQKTNAGSRSEGRSHVLAVNGYVLPDVFDLVYAADAYYRFEPGAQVWDDSGFVLDRTKKGDAPYGETDRSISGRDWELGWYEGSRRKEGTPRSWIYMERDDLKAFINPDEIDRFVRYKGLEEMPRFGLEAKG